MIEQRICPKCQISKNRGEFYKDVHNAHGISHNCKSCTYTHVVKRPKIEIVCFDRVCKVCLLTKPIQQFGKNKQGKSGKKYLCLSCKRERSVKYRIEQKTKGINTYRDLPEQKRKELIKKQTECAKRKRHSDSLYAFKQQIRSMMCRSFKRREIKKAKKTEEILGCSLIEFRTYIENLFHSGMNWDNKGYYGWHIDHKIPLALANSEEEVIKLCHYTNLQPMWQQDNFNKADRLDFIMIK